MFTQIKEWLTGLRDKSEGLSLPYIAFFLSLFTGLVLSFVLPPFQAPDEVNHFYKAWHIAEGNFSTQKENNRIGGYIPSSVDSLARYFSQYRFSPNPDIKFGEISQFMDFPLEPGFRTFQDFPNTGMYNPVCYLPYLLPMYGMIQFECPPLLILYFARISAAVCWSLAIFFCLKWAPRFRVLLFVLGMLPMSLFIQGTVNADVMLNASVFMLIGYIFRQLKIGKPINRYGYLISILFIVIISSLKLLYSPVLLLFVCWPDSMYQNRIHRVSSLLLFAIISFATILYWASESQSIYTPYELYNTQFRNGLDLTPDANMNSQMDALKVEPMKLLSVLTQSTFENAQSYAESYIGRLGWYNVRLPLVFILASYLVMILAILYPGEKLNLRIQVAILLLIAFLLIWILIILSQYLTWEKVGAERVYLLQGRYYISVFPLLWMGASLMIRKRIQTPIGMFVLYALLSCLITIGIVWDWYY